MEKCRNCARKRQLEFLKLALKRDQSVRRKTRLNSRHVSEKILASNVNFIQKLDCKHKGEEKVDFNQGKGRKEAKENERNIANFS